MSNLRKVNDDILKDWLLFRKDELSSLTCDEDRKHWVYFDEISERILKNIQKKIELTYKNDLTCLMRILWIFLAIGMRNIIGMIFVMEFS